MQTKPWLASPVAVKPVTRLQVLNAFGPGLCVQLAQDRLERLPMYTSGCPLPTSTRVYIDQSNLFAGTSTSAAVTS